MPTSPAPRAPLTGGVPASSRAVVQHEYGTDPAAVLAVETVATPQPGPGELLVRVEAVSLDMGTWHLMSGLPYPVRAAMGLGRPRRQNPVYAGTGVVVAVGADVADHAVGDAVIGVAIALTLAAPSAFPGFTCHGLSILQKSSPPSRAASASALTRPWYR